MGKLINGPYLQRAVVVQHVVRRCFGALLQFGGADFQFFPNGFEKVAF